jgi:hypothetical protein
MTKEGCSVTSQLTRGFKSLPAQIIKQTAFSPNKNSQKHIIAKKQKGREKFIPEFMGVF